MSDNSARRAGGISIIGPDGQVRTLNATERDKFLARLSDPDLPATLTAGAKRAIQSILACPTVPDDLKELLGQQKFIGDLPTKAGQVAAVHKLGSAMCPVFDTGFIIIGALGSVWTDCTYRGKHVRIAIYPDATDAMQAYEIDEFEA